MLGELPVQRVQAFFEHKSGITPLSIAAYNGHETCVQRLLEAGAEVDKVTPFGTALSDAMENGHENCAALLRAAGAKDVR